MRPQMGKVTKREREREKGARARARAKKTERMPWIHLPIRRLVGVGARVG
jgi:hypothetical protein